MLNVAVNNSISIPGFQSTSNNVCEGDSILLTSNTPFHNLWSTGDTTRFIYVKTGGNYTLTVNDSANCLAGTSNPFSITLRPRPDTPVLTADGPTEFCAGGSVFVSAPFVNTGQFYSWSDGLFTTGPGRFASVSDTLSVVRIDFSGFGCKSLPSNELSIIVNPLPNAPSITADGPTVFCPGDSVVLTSSVASGNVWSSGDTTQNAVIKVSGTVNLFLVDENGCQSPSVFQLVLVESPASPPVINTSGLDTVLCQGEATILSATGGSSNQQFVWNTGVSPFGNILSVNSTGSYYAYFVSSNGCISANSDTVDIVVNPNPAKPVIVSAGPLILNSGNNILCSNDSLVLSTALPAYEYKWEAGGFSVFSADSTFLVVNPPLVAFGGKAYTVTVRDSLGCVSQISDAIVVGGQTSPVASIFLAANQQAVFCDGGGTIITANVLNQNYLWSNGQTTFSFPVDSSGIYTLTVTDNIGCVSAPSAPFTVTEIPGTTTPVITASGKLNYCPGEPINLTLTSSSPTDNSWAGLNTFTQSINVFLPGIYTVNTFNNANCILGSASIEITQDPYMPVPVITPLTATSICPGDSIVLSSDQPVRNIWSTGDTSQVITIHYADIGATGAMPVYLNYFNENGCRGLDSVVIGIFQIIPDTAKMVVMGSTNFCDGSSVVLMSQSFAANYFWSTGETSLSITVSDPTTITLQWFNNNVGCLSIISSPVVLNELPNLIWYRDSDLDGFGDLAVTTSNCILPAGYVSDSTDCNDFNSLILNPQRYFADTDNDGYGDLNDFVTVCAAPSGYVADSLDCNDTDNQIRPGGFEKCNAIDDDCDQLIDDGVVQPVITASGTTMICAPGSVTLTSDVPAGNLWNTGAFSSSITVLQGGIYYITNSINLCTSDTLQVIGCFELKMHQAIAAAGKDISGSNGNVSFTVGQPFFVTKTGSTGNVRDGIQQPYASPSGVLNVFVFLQGFYQPGNPPLIEILGPGICDTITVNLHAGSAPYAKLYSKKVLLNSSGTASLPVPSSLQGSSYFISIQHRNSIETWSKEPVMLGASTGFDFTH